MRELGGMLALEHQVLCKNQGKLWKRLAKVQQPKVQTLKVSIQQKFSDLTLGA